MYIRASYWKQKERRNSTNLIKMNSDWTELKKFSHLLPVNMPLYEDDFFPLDNLPNRDNSCHALFSRCCLCSRRKIAGMPFFCQYWWPWLWLASSNSPWLWSKAEDVALNMDELSNIVWGARMHFHSTRRMKRFERLECALSHIQWVVLMPSVFHVRLGKSYDNCAETILYLLQTLWRCHMFFAPFSTNRQPFEFVRLWIGCSSKRKTRNVRETEKID